MNNDSPSFPDRRSVRMRGFDYSQAGAYFVTICTADRRCVLGNIDDGTMAPSLLGMIVREEWEHSGAMRLDFHLDAFVLMPNHVHAIVRIGVGILAERSGDSPASTRGTKPKSLSSFVQGFKAATTSRALREGGWRSGPLWQRGFYEHVIRTERAFAVIRRYIAMNPRLWRRDTENPDKRGVWSG